MKRILKSAALIALGVIIGWIGAWVTQRPTCELRERGKDSSVLGTRHYYGAEARTLAARAGIPLPQAGIDCYYGIGGLKPVWEFIAVTLAREKAWPWISALSGKTKADARDVGFCTPEALSSRDRSVLFAVPAFATNSVIRWKVRGALTASAAVDENSGRVFIAISE